MEDLRKLRSALKSKQTRFESFLAKFNTLDLKEVSNAQVIEIENRLQANSNLLSEFDLIQNEILKLSKDLDTETDYSDQFQSAFFNLNAIAQDLLAKIRSISNKGTKSPCSSTSSGQKSKCSHKTPIFNLPKISVPHFSGQIDSWLEYKAIFNSLIHSNKDIDDVQKLHYLKASLSGEAAQTIKSLEFSSSNYNVAWQSICYRYDQSRLLIRNHLKSILDLEPCTKESATLLRQFSDALFKHVSALRSLADDGQLFETFIIYVMSTKLDSVTSRQWETVRNASGNDLPTLHEFKTFLTNNANLVDSLQPKQQAKVVPEKTKPHSSKSFVPNTPTCAVCKNPHSISSCEQFLKLSSHRKINKAKELKLCLNCLHKGHYKPQCSSRFICRTCKSKHHTLLHIESNSIVNREEQPVPANEAEAPAVSDQSISALCTNTYQVLLPTASAKILDSSGREHTIRILLDSGSQSNFLRTDLAQRFNLHIQHANILVAGLNQAASSIRSKCDVVIRSHHTNFQLKLNCLVLDEITGTMPSVQIDRKNLRIPDNITLSDPLFCEPGNIYMLIGSTAFFLLMCVGQVRMGPHAPILQKTRLGWVVSGEVGTMIPSRCHLSVLDDLPDRISKFWELESYPEKRVLSTEESACEVHFKQNTSRDTNGRFVVSLPLKGSVECLGDSKDIAQKRFLALERRLQADPDLSMRYSAFMQEYQDLGHMSVSDSDINQVSYYLPHHGVLKETSITTKLRVVFNGSSASTSGQSLNDIQMVGPTIQQDLFSILVRVRKYTYAISADIEKMYRQVLVEPSQRPLQRILWRASPSEPIKSFDLNTVTYWTASAAFLSIRCLYQLGIDCEVSNPEVSQIIKNDFYVDDLLTGADDISQARKLCLDLSNVLRLGCFNLRKWISNDPRILADFPDTEVHPGVLEFGDAEHASTLGLIWSFQADSFMFSIATPTIGSITKRSMLSEISQIFDPLGVLAPGTVRAKILLQQLWLERLSWDDPLPERIQVKWSSYKAEIIELNDLEVPRHVICRDAVDVQLHGFCDSSIYAYGACLYIRSVDKYNNVSSKLLCAKTKVAPLKPMTNPKLELSAAALLAKLSEQALKALDMQISSCYLWSDSTIVLGWLKTSPNLLKTFVCNRVVDIQQRTSHAIWQHVPTKSNPADLLSRGLTPKVLKVSRLWWDGPVWLFQDESAWPNSHVASSQFLPELKKEAQSLVVATNDPIVKISHFSSMTRLKRVIGYSLRFSKNCCLPSEGRTVGPLTCLELREALSCLIKISQAESFPEELKQLKQAQPRRRSSSLISLNPFLDASGIIRVGGRLQNSEFNFYKRHPILLSGKHCLSKLIVSREHLRMLHAGPQLLLASLRSKFWITSGRCLTKQVVHQCLKCFRFSAKTVEPIMGNLPLSRIKPAPPFHTTGVDYGGPFLIKDRKGRGSKSSKCYLCIFICFVTKAVHLELVTSLTTESFIMTFRRFVSRRGKPMHVYSDNGTNFVGANSALKELRSFLKSNCDSVTDALVSEGTQWHFIPARSPHFGGLWEAGIKSVKNHLKRVLGNSLLTYEEFYTLLTQVEAALNSRPLTPLSTDPNDLQPIIPAHFLVGRPITALPDPDVSEIQQPRLSSYQHVQQLHQRIWKRWSREYVSELQQRSKWQQHH